MNTYAIGDIHGCRRSLECLLHEIGLKASDQIVLLGDYVDRGDDTKGTLELILQLEKTHRVISLRGNHEVMLLEAREDPLQAHLWSSYGGFETLVSYDAIARPDWTAAIPDRHWEFVERTQLYYETEENIFVHGFLQSDLPVANQSPDILLWEKCHSMTPHQSGKLVVCGHTPHSDGVPGSYDWGVCIDTAAARGGWLTCFEPASGRYWQANEQAEVRTGRIE